MQKGESVRQKREGERGLMEGREREKEILKCFFVIHY